MTEGLRKCFLINRHKNPKDFDAVISRLNFQEEAPCSVFLQQTFRTLHNSNKNRRIHVIFLVEPHEHIKLH